MKCNKKHTETKEFDRKVEAATSTFLIEPYSSFLGPFTNPVLNSMEFDVRLMRTKCLGSTAAALRHSCCSRFCKGAKHHNPLPRFMDDLVPFRLPLVFQACVFLLIK